MNGAARSGGGEKKRRVSREELSRRGENERRTRRLRNARESLEPLSTTNEARYIARSPFARRAALISPSPLTLGKSLWRSAHAKVSFPRTKVTGKPKRDERIRGDARYGLLYCSNDASRSVWECCGRCKSFESKTRASPHSLRSSIKSFRFYNVILFLLYYGKVRSDSIRDYKLFTMKAGGATAFKKRKGGEVYGFHLILIQLSISWRWYRSPFGSKRRNNR